MKNVKHKYGKYIAWGITALAVLICAILIYFGLDELGEFFKALGSLMRILSPFIWGLIISYLIMPSMLYYERKIFQPLIDRSRKKHPGRKEHPKLARTLAVILAEIVLLMILTLLVYLVVPQLYESVSTLVANSPEYFDKAYSYLENLFQKNPVIEKYGTKLFGNLTDALTKWGTNTLMPGMESLVSNITSGVYSVLRMVYDLLVGIIASVYVLYNRESIRVHAKKLFYSMFNVKTVNTISGIVDFVDKTFMGYIMGRLIDSAIIGVLCYIGCLILGIPYALLISVIVGLTNVIIFFGPFMGAIPSALLILMVDPVKCLVFIIFIIVLQQFDGNILGPKILSGAIGINGFWVLFSIIVFGGMFGFWGMLLGVPVFVVIYTAIEMLIDQKLKKKNMPTEAGEYENLAYVDTDSGELVKKPAEEQ